MCLRSDSLGAAVEGNSSMIRPGTDLKFCFYFSKIISGVMNLTPTLIEKSRSSFVWSLALPAASPQ